MANPLEVGLGIRRTPDPCALVVFGASGDLTKRKLFPALYSLAYRRLLPENFAVVGVSRSEETDEEFKERMKEAVQEFGRDPFRDDAWELLAGGMRYVSMDFADEEGQKRLADALNELDEARALLDQLAEAGVDYDDVVATLEDEGVQKFSDSFEDLLDGIRDKLSTVGAR